MCGTLFEPSAREEYTVEHDEESLPGASDHTTARYLTVDKAQRENGRLVLSFRERDVPQPVYVADSLLSYVGAKPADNLEGYRLLARFRGGRIREIVAEPAI